MKKWQKAMATALVAGVMTVGAVAGLASCSKTPEEAAKITETYIGSYVITETIHVDDSDGQGTPADVTSTYTYYEQLQLLDDGTYAMTQTQVTNMATYVVYATGSYTKNEKDARYEGYTEIVLNKATYVLVNQDIYNHMFSLTIDTEKSTFPHEIAGGATKTKDEILTEFGSFGSRFIMHVANVTDTSAENWIDIEDNVQVVE